MKIMNWVENMEELEKKELIKAIINVLKFSPAFTKRDEKEVKKIFKKLEKRELTYLANLFDELYEYLSSTLRQERES